METLLLFLPVCYTISAVFAILKHETPMKALLAALKIMGIILVFVFGIGYLISL